MEEQREKEKEKEPEPPSSPPLLESVSTLRARNWEWNESYELLCVLKQTGKSWGLALERLHVEKHLLTHINEPDKLREHYNRFTRKDSPLKKEYITPKLPIKPAARKKLLESDAG